MCFKKALLVPLVVLLLSALLATATVPAGHVLDAEHPGLRECAKMRNCTERLCWGMCDTLGTNRMGSCMMEGKSSYCCCYPKSSTVDISVHKLV
ncbi:hypothetical protein HU200_029359 [Digitaria exilis]|uniref:Uncharacterized protein n=1 Tax=Digitaria exilis TaxID=1010633 RepID=A0A835BR50_9POAL|nr:hypothetical protein HU200_029359 [Digitaria exilis]